MSIQKKNTLQILPGINTFLVIIPALSLSAKICLVSPTFHCMRSISSEIIWIQMRSTLWISIFYLNIYNSLNFSICFSDFIEFFVRNNPYFAPVCEHLLSFTYISLDMIIPFRNHLNSIRFKSNSLIPIAPK